MPADVTVGVLNKVVLAANGWPEFGGEFDLLGDHLPDLPERPGVYVVLTHDGQPHRYPFGWSWVIYIGCAFGLRGLGKRLSDHHTEARKCRVETQGRLYRPLYEWIKSAGGVALFSVAPEDDASAERMETLLLNTFTSVHYALPVANGKNGAQYIDRTNWVFGLE